MKKRTYRIVAFCILIIFFMSTAISFGYIILEENHECTGEDCPVCATIQLAEFMLRQIGTTEAGLCRIIMPIWVVCLVYCAGSLICKNTTLITEKVRMND